MVSAFTITKYPEFRQATRRAVFLNSQVLLTRGTRSISLGALFSPLSPLTGIYTYTCEKTAKSEQLFAQVLHPEDSGAAYCLFLAPAKAVNAWAVSELFDGMIAHLGNQGVHHLVAEADENHQVVSLLRKNGFSIYTRQRVWRLTSSPARKGKSAWRPMGERDQLAANLLHKAVVPGQVLQMELQPALPRDGFVYHRQGELVAFAEVEEGSRGIWVQPFVHPDAEPFDQPLAELLSRLGPKRGKPVYVVLRAYQDWLQGPLREMGARPGPRQVVMVRRTNLPLPVEDPLLRLATVRRAETGTPIRVRHTHYEN
ncbi:MAG: hypothetical protein KIS85_00355 [Anaerolineales bacterium]|nr:hypothetical protein [Anaerolineales bacterium]